MRVRLLCKVSPCGGLAAPAGSSDAFASLSLYSSLSALDCMCVSCVCVCVCVPHRERRSENEYLRECSCCTVSASLEEWAKIEGRSKGRCAQV